MDPSKFKILVVDDDPDIREYIKEAIDEAGFTVIEADNANKGLALFESETPDLMVVDIFMPDMNGFEMIENIRKSKPAYNNFVICSGYEENEDKAYAADVEAYISKPFTSEELIKTVQNYVYEEI